MSEWKPIDENTPRMKVILMWGETYDLGSRKNWKMATGSIHRYDDIGPEEIIWDGQNLQDWDYKPTHWMPIPEPPASTHNPEKEE